MHWVDTSSMQLVGCPPNERSTFGEDVRVADLTLRIRCAVGELARWTGKTPRTIFEEEFAQAPGDDWWRALEVDA